LLSVPFAQIPRCLPLIQLKATTQIHNEIRGPRREDRLASWISALNHATERRTTQMEQSHLLTHCGSSKITREELKVIPTPAGSATHQPLPHFEIVGALVETLSLRQISVVREEYAVSGDGMKMFGVLDLETTFDGCRFSVGVRNSNDKSMRLALTVGYRVLVCDNMAFHGDFTPILAKHTKHLSLVDILSVGVDRMQRSFEPMRKQVEAWKSTRISDETAKLIIYRAFVEGELAAPKHLARAVHNHYFNPRVEEFAPRTLWSLSNAFTGTFKNLDPIPQFHVTAELAPFLEVTRAVCSYPQ
jgi:hypothetical protein